MYAADYRPPLRRHLGTRCPLGQGAEAVRIDLQLLQRSSEHHSGVLILLGVRKDNGRANEVTDFLCSLFGTLRLRKAGRYIVIIIVNLNRSLKRRLLLGCWRLVLRFRAARLADYRRLS